MKFISKELHASLKKGHLRVGDVLLVTRGSLGMTASVTKEFEDANINAQLVLLRGDNETIDSRYLFFVVSSPDFFNQVMSNSSGTAQPQLPITPLKRLTIPVGSITIQRRIAGILSAYDDLIENNTRRIKILEQMAQAIYSEWFVHFRFPGYEKVKLVTSSLGPIPEGWHVKSIGQITSFLNRGLSPSYDQKGDSLVLNQKCIRGHHLSLAPARRQRKPIPSEKLIRFGDVLINSTGVGTLGRVAQVYNDMEQCTVDSHVTIVRPSPGVDIDFFGCALLKHEETFERLGVGATGQTELSRAAVGRVELTIPPGQVQRRFGKHVCSMRLAGVTISKQIANLHRTRDLLLPKLISGEVDVEQIEIAS